MLGAHWDGSVSFHHHHHDYHHHQYHRHHPHQWQLPVLGAHWRHWDDSLCLIIFIIINIITFIIMKYKSKSITNTKNKSATNTICKSNTYTKSKSTNKVLKIKQYSNQIQIWNYPSTNTKFANTYTNVSTIYKILHHRQSSRATSILDPLQRVLVVLFVIVLHSYPEILPPFEHHHHLRIIQAILFSYLQK